MAFKGERDILAAHIQSWEDITNQTPNLLMSDPFFYSLCPAWGWLVISFWHCIWVGEWAGYLWQAPQRGCRVCSPWYWFLHLGTCIRGLNRPSSRLKQIKHNWINFFSPSFLGCPHTVLGKYSQPQLHPKLTNESSFLLLSTSAIGVVGYIFLTVYVGGWVGGLLMAGTHEG